MKALIIEDSQSDRDLLTQLVRASWGLDVPLDIVAVSTLAEGLAQSQDANVTIMDLDLKDSTPENTKRSIKLLRQPVIILTGDDSPTTIADCKIHGASRVFYKGAIMGLMAAIFESMQKDIIQITAERAAARAHTGDERAA